MHTITTFVATALFTVFSGGAAFADVPPKELTGAPIMNETTCGDLILSQRYLLTPEEEVEVTTFTYSGTLIVAAFDNLTDDDETTIINGLYDGVWTIAMVTTDEDIDDAERLIRAAHFQAGGKAALEAYSECVNFTAFELLNAAKDLVGELKNLGR